MGHWADENQGTAHANDLQKDTDSGEKKKKGYRLWNHTAESKICDSSSIVNIEYIVHMNTLNMNTYEYVQYEYIEHMIIVLQIFIIIITFFYSKFF